MESAAEQRQKVEVELGIVTKLREAMSNLSTKLNAVVVMDQEIATWQNSINSRVQQRQQQLYEIEVLYMDVAKYRFNLIQFNQSQKSEPPKQVEQPQTLERLDREVV